MDPSYTFTMSLEDQQKFTSIDKTIKYGHLLESIKGGDSKTVDFKEQSSSKFILSRIQPKKVLQTILSFPLDLPLNNKGIYNYPETTFCPSPEKIYDVRFIMPLIFHSVSPNLYVDCRDFIAKRCLAITLIGLSSFDHQMRALCYKILERYHHHLLSSLIIDKNLWINLLDLIRGSVPSPNARLKHLFTMFLTKIIDILLHPHQDKMYEIIKEFLSGRPKLRIDTIEIYDDLMLCSDVDLYNNNVRWLVTLFRDGTRTKDDLEILHNLKVIPHAMCLYNSELRFQRANETILTLFKRITTIESGTTLLVEEYSFLPWLHQTIMIHLNQQPGDLKHDPKAESLSDLSTELTSLVCNIVDSLIRKKKSEQAKRNISDLMEAFCVFVALHDLIIKAKQPKHLSYYLDYSRKVAKAIRKDDRIPDNLAGYLLNLMKAKLHYLFI